MDMPRTGELAHLGKSVFIKGELTGSEDLYVDGSVQGTIELQGNNLTIGPNGQVKANINAKGVVVQGRLEGNVQASDRVELRKSAVMMGDIVTQRVAIEDGAYLKGKVDIHKAPGESKSEPKKDSTSAEAAYATGGRGSGSAGGPATAVDSKK